jgi:NTE family protein
MHYSFKNLVFEGGGVKGIAYVGALEVLKRKGILDAVIRVGGASAGAITALLLALGFSSDRIQFELRRIDFRKFQDGSGLVANLLRVLRSYGWYKGDYFKEWIEGLIAEQTGNPEITFGQFADLRGTHPGFRDIVILGTNLSKRTSQIYSHYDTPGVPLAEAVRISMSIPVMFRAVVSSDRDVMVDGGVLDNYPVKLFDREVYLSDRAEKIVPGYYQKRNALRTDSVFGEYVYNHETLGFRLDSRDEINVFRDHRIPESHPIANIAAYVEALVQTLLDAQSNQHLHSDDWKRTIYIDTLQVSTTQFDMSNVEKDLLINSGRAGTETYFRWYDTAANIPPHQGAEMPAGR